MARRADTRSPPEDVDVELLAAARRYTAAVRSGALAEESLGQLMREFHEILTRLGWTHEDWARHTAKQ